MRCLASGVCLILDIAEMQSFYCLRRQFSCACLCLQRLVGSETWTVVVAKAESERADVLLTAATPYMHEIFVSLFRWLKLWLMFVTFICFFPTRDCRIPLATQISLSSYCCRAFNGAFHVSRTFCSNITHHAGARLDSDLVFVHVQGTITQIPFKWYLLARGLRYWLGS